MNRYKKLKAAQGLIISLDEQLYLKEQFKHDDITEAQIVDQYFIAVKEVMDMENK